MTIFDPQWNWKFTTPTYAYQEHEFTATQMQNMLYAKNGDVVPMKEPEKVIYMVHAAYRLFRELAADIQTYRESCFLGIPVILTTHLHPYSVLCADLHIQNEVGDIIKSQVEAKLSSEERRLGDKACSQDRALSAGGTAAAVDYGGYRGADRTGRSRSVCLEDRSVVMDALIEHRCDKFPAPGEESTLESRYGCGPAIESIYWAESSWLASSSNGEYSTCISFCPFCGLKLANIPLEEPNRMWTMAAIGALIGLAAAALYAWKIGALLWLK